MAMLKSHVGTQSTELSVCLRRLDRLASTFIFLWVLPGRGQLYLLCAPLHHPRRTRLSVLPHAALPHSISFRSCCNVMGYATRQPRSRSWSALTMARAQRPRLLQAAVQPSTPLHGRLPVLCRPRHVISAGACDHHCVHHCLLSMAITVDHISTHSSACTCTQVQGLSTSVNASTPWPAICLIFTSFILVLQRYNQQ